MKRFFNRIGSRLSQHFTNHFTKFKTSDSSITSSKFSNRLKSIVTRTIHNQKDVTSNQNLTSHTAGSSSSSSSSSARFPFLWQVKQTEPENIQETPLEELLDAIDVIEVSAPAPLPRNSRGVIIKRPGSRRILQCPPLDLVARSASFSPWERLRALFGKKPEWSSVERVGFMGKFYAVRRGRKPGIYLTWAECEACVKGFKGAAFKSFPSREDAEKFVRGEITVQLGQKRSRSERGGEGSAKRPRIIEGPAHLPPAGTGPFIDIYTDGSCPNNVGSASRQGAAGWGFISSSQLLGVKDHYGPVVFSKEDDMFMGAEVGTNNTGELSAVGFACRYVLQEDPAGESELRIFYDSEYAAKIASGTFNANKNIELADQVQDLLAQVIQKRRVTFHKVKGHSNNPMNDRADENANKGASGDRNVWPTFSHTNLLESIMNPKETLDSKRVPPAMSASAPSAMSASSGSASARQGGPMSNQVRSMSAQSSVAESTSPRKGSRQPKLEEMFLRATSVNNGIGGNSSGASASRSPSVDVSLNSSDGFSKFASNKSVEDTLSVQAHPGSIASPMHAISEEEQLRQLLKNETRRREMAEARVKVLESENKSLRSEVLQMTRRENAAVGKSVQAESVIALDSDTD